MTRTIHPVGQGAFYSETFTDEDKQAFFTAVYDCGSQNNKHLKRLIKDVKITANLLFISHFHNDHTNGVLDLLSDQSKRCNIVIPGITHCRFVVDLIYIYTRTKSIGSPSIKFMLSCIPALKKPWSTAGIVYADDNFPGIICKHPASSVTYSVMAISPTIGRPVPLFEPSIHWYYDANYTEIDPSKEEQLIRELSVILPSLETIMPDLEEYRDSDWYERHLLSVITEDKLNDIGEIFTKVFGASHHNSYSMLVHSHPEMGRTDKRMNCLYTGDAEKRTVINAVNTSHPHYIQVPHHGSKRNYDVAIYSDYPIVFISVGKSFPYGHPSQTTLLGLIRLCQDIHITTEDKGTRYKWLFTF